MGKLPRKQREPVSESTPSPVAKAVMKRKSKADSDSSSGGLVCDDARRRFSAMGLKADSAGPFPNRSQPNSSCQSLATSSTLSFMVDGNIRMYASVLTNTTAPQRQTLVKLSNSEVSFA